MSFSFLHLGIGWDFGSDYTSFFYHCLLCFLNFADPCGDDTKHMVGDTWIPDASDPCLTCTCVIIPEDPTGMKGVTECDRSACSEEPGMHTVHFSLSSLAKGGGGGGGRVAMKSGNLSGMF